VDDLVLGAAHWEDIRWIKAGLSKAFEMTDLNELKVLLGLEITRDRSQRQLTIHQQRYIDRIVNRYGMNDARPIATPLDLHTKLLAGTKTDGEDNQIESVPIEAYQSAVGSLMYAMLGARPDIAYAIGLVSQFNHSPRWNHWLAVKRTFRYLGATRHWGLRYWTSNVSGRYSDADWGAGEDQKSVGEFVFFLNGGAISWTGKKQNSIELSTTEAESMAMTQATKDILWLRVLLDKLGAFAHI